MHLQGSCGAVWVYKGITKQNKSAAAALGVLKKTISFGVFSGKLSSDVYFAADADSCSLAFSCHSDCPVVISACFVSNGKIMLHGPFMQHHLGVQVH